MSAADTAFWTLAGLAVVVWTVTDFVVWSRSHDSNGHTTHTAGVEAATRARRVHSVDRVGSNGR